MREDKDKLGITQLRLEDAVETIINHFDDSTREGLVETPKRYIKFLQEFHSAPEVNFTTFNAEGYDQMIVQANIPFYSLCEHHLAPFFGTATIGYIPKDKLVGLSKIARTLDYYANRFQNQERITSQVADRIDEELRPKGVAVVLKAQHLCMNMRGVKKHNTWTTTSKLLGNFRKPEVRQEFLQFHNSEI